MAETYLVSGEVTRDMEGADLLRAQIDRDLPDTVSTPVRAGLERAVEDLSVAIDGQGPIRFELTLGPDTATLTVEAG